MTVRIVARVLAQLLLIGAISCATGPTTHDTSRSCDGGHWLPAQQLRTPDGYTVFMELPEVLPMHGKAFILSSLAMTYDSAGSVVWPLATPRVKKVERPEHIAVGVIADASGVSQLVPQPRELAVWPNGSIATSDDRGVAHVVWASNDSAPSTSLMMMRSLWYARFENDRWNAPARILTTPGELMWTPSTKSSLVARAGTLHMAVAVMGEGIRYVRFGDGAWTNHTVGGLGAVTGYPHVAALADGRVVIIAQGAVPHPRSQTMSVVYASWSDDGGRSWVPRIQVSDSLSEPAYDFQLLIDGTVLYAIWFQQTDERGEPALKPKFMEGPGRVQIARSVDRGGSWQRLAASSLRVAARGLQALMQRDHTILITLVDGGSERVYTATWSNGWRPFETHDARPAPFNPTLGLDGAHRPVLTWGIRHTHDWVGTMMSTYVPCPRGVAEPRHPPSGAPGATLGNT